LQEQVGTDGRIYLIGLKKLVIMCDLLDCFLLLCGFEYLSLQERERLACIGLSFAWICNVFLPGRSLGTDTYLCVCSFRDLFTGPEPDRQVDLLERKHPYFLPCPFIQNEEEAHEMRLFPVSRLGGILRAVAK
jgi:hypothetical protein